MNRTLIFTALALATGLALAQAPAPAGGEGREARMAEMRERMDARFAAADKDGNGRIDPAEASAVGERFGKHFERMDANKDGGVDRAEMAAAARHMHERRRGARHAMQGHRAFMRGLWIGLDDDKDGLVSRAELGDKMPRWGEKFEAMDANRDGKLSPGEVGDYRRAMRAEKRGQADA